MDHASGFSSAHSAENATARRPRWSRHRRLPAVLTAILTLATLGVAAGGVLACDSGGAADTGLDRQTFIEVMVALREAEMAVEEQDSAAALFQVRRDSILADFGVAEEDLLAFVGSQRDLQEMEETWDTIARRLVHEWSVTGSGPPPRPVEERSFLDQRPIRGTDR